MYRDSVICSSMKLFRQLQCCWGINLLWVWRTCARTAEYEIIILLLAIWYGAVRYHLFAFSLYVHHYMTIVVWFFQKHTRALAEFCITVIVNRHAQCVMDRCFSAGSFDHGSLSVTLLNNNTCSMSNGWVYGGRLCSHLSPFISCIIHHLCL